MQGMPKIEERSVETVVFPQPDLPDIAIRNSFCYGIKKLTIYSNTDNINNIQLYKEMSYMKIFAHRGASGYAPENTLSAIKKAIEMKADGIEIDIQLTKDGKIVVIHDWKVDRTTTGRGFVYELDFDYIRSLDAGQWYTKDFIGEVVPTLEEVLDILPNDMMLNIEIKDTARKHSNIEEKMLEVLKKYPEKFDNIIVSSFHHDKIKRLQELEPKLKLALLTDSEFIEIEKYLSTNGLKSYSYHPEINLISKEDVEILHKNGVKVFVWTVNKEEDLAYLVKLGVDGVITNYPDIMKELLM